MRREGNQVIFDSEAEHREFADVCARAEGANIVMEQMLNKVTSGQETLNIEKLRELLNQLGRTTMEKNAAFARAQRLCNLGPKEALTYEWANHELLVGDAPKTQNP